MYAAISSKKQSVLEIYYENYLESTWKSLPKLFTEVSSKFAIFLNLNKPVWNTRLQYMAVTWKEIGTYLTKVSCQQYTITRLYQCDIPHSSPSTVRYSRPRRFYSAAQTLGGRGHGA